MFRHEVWYTGPIVSHDGYWIDNQKKKPYPFLDPGRGQEIAWFTNYYRKYILDFARKASVMYVLLKNPKTKEVQTKTSKNSWQQKVERGQRILVKKVEWQQFYAEASGTLLVLLSRPDGIVYPNYDMSDASNRGLGTVLYQSQNNCFNSNCFWLVILVICRKGVPHAVLIF